MQSRRLRRKATVACIVVIVYILGQNIMLPYVRLGEMDVFSNQTFGQMIQTANGSGRQSFSIFALGIMPYMMASILLMLKNLGSSNKNRISVISPVKQVKLVTLFLCLVLSFLRTADYEYTFIFPGSPVLARLFTMIVLIAGVFAIVWLADLNTGDGIGGMSLIIIVNILKNITRNVLKIWNGFESGVYGTRKDYCQIILLVGIGLIALFTILLFEESEIRIPVQKVMIYNEMSKDNYMAFKLDPIGIQPMMYVMAFYIIPYNLLNILIYLFPGRKIFVTLAECVQLDTYTGLVLFLFLYFFLSLALTMVEIDPSDLAEQMQKSGDCISGLRPGKETQSYIKKIVLNLAIFSSVILGVLIALPMVLRIIWKLPQELSMIPMSLMFIGGISRNIFQEIKVVGRLDGYREVL